MRTIDSSYAARVAAGARIAEGSRIIAARIIANTAKTANVTDRGRGSGASIDT